MEACEGIGEVPVQVYYPLGEEPPQPVPAPPTPGTEYGAMAERWNSYAARRMLGREARRTFLNLPNEALSPLSLWNYFVVGIASNVAASVQGQLQRKG